MGTSVTEGEFESWQEKTDTYDVIWVDHNKTRRRVTLLLDEEEFSVIYPETYPKGGLFVFETKAKKHTAWVGLVNGAVSSKTGAAKFGDILTIAMGLRKGGGEPTEDADEASDEDLEADDDSDDDAKSKKEEMIEEEDDAFEEGLEDLRKKKRWQKREAELRAKLKEEAAGHKAVTTIFSSTAATGVLTNDLLLIMKEKMKLGISAEPIDDNIYHWNVKLFNFKPDTPLAADLEVVKRQFGYDYVELEVSFTIDLYPFYPPTIRVVRPRLQGFMMGRVTSLDILKLSYWDPVKDMRSVLGIVRELLEDYGRLDANNPLNDRTTTPAGAYSPLEYHLLRLELLTETSPRANLKYPDRESILRKSATGTSSAAQPSGGKPNSNKGTYWAKGTGYGSGCTSNSRWDVNAYLAAQKQKDNETEALLKSIHREIVHPSSKIPYDVVEESCLIPALESYLRNDSLLDMGRHASLYIVVFDILLAISNTEELLPILDTLPHQTTSLIDLMKNQNTRASVIVSRVTDDTDAAMLKLAKKIIESYKSASAGLDRVNAETRALEASRTASSSASTSTSTSTSAAATTSTLPPDKLYISQMEPLMFDVVTMDLRGHHYHSHSSTGTPNKNKVMRLAQEQATLSTALPITLDSSVFVRVDSNNMDFMRALITGPMASDYGVTSTPYAGGCFMFDIFIPQNYPDGPPLVNLQTTGNGSVRFNPNLYHCGKVCLSLLGTWSGAEGENWNRDTSTLLQVFVSIQSLIMVPMPFFNEPGYESQMGTPSGDTNNRQYNEVIRCGTLDHAIIGQLQNPSPGFEEVIQKHFYLQQNRIIEQVNRWIAEAQSTNRTHYSRLLKQLATMQELFAKLPKYPFPPLPA
ncbi:Ubiquitin-conjugating BIR-domain enzyme [Pelomyxa schiedti]|nr:Ubiquitin-conjugating BIR-domain enzyme [Pelomyxa schiedti]